MHGELRETNRLIAGVFASQRWERNLPKAGDCSVAAAAAEFDGWAGRAAASAGTAARRWPRVGGRRLAPIRTAPARRWPHRPQWRHAAFRHALVADGGAAGQQGRAGDSGRGGPGRSSWRSHETAGEALAGPVTDSPPAQADRGRTGPDRPNVGAVTGGRPRSQSWRAWQSERLSFRERGRGRWRGRERRGRGALQR